MSAEHNAMFDRKMGAGLKDDAQFATWLALIAFTFFFGTFVAANVYLRSWSPDKFTMKLTGAVANLPYIATLCLLVAAILLFVGGAFFRKAQYGKFQATMAIATLPIVGYGIMAAWMMILAIGQGAQVATTYASVYGLMVMIAAASVAFLMAMGWYFSQRDEAALIRLVPTAMTVFMYTVMTGLVVLIITDIVSVGGFAEWCGNKILLK